MRCCDSAARLASYRSAPDGCFVERRHLCYAISIWHQSNYLDLSPFYPNQNGARMAVRGAWSGHPSAPITNASHTYSSEKLIANDRTHDCQFGAIFRLCFCCVGASQIATCHIIQSISFLLPHLLSACVRVWCAFVSSCLVCSICALSLLLFVIAVGVDFVIAVASAVVIVVVVVGAAVAAVVAIVLDQIEYVYVRFYPYFV